MTTVFGRSLRATPAPLRGSARYAVFGLAAIAIAGCVSEEQRQANAERSDRRATQELAQRDFDGTYQACIYRVTGAFSSASIDVMKECEKQGCFVVAAVEPALKPIPCQIRAQSPTGDQ